MIDISIKRYEELLKAESKLTLLEYGGVDNWEWYDCSLETLKEAFDEIDILITKLKSVKVS